MSSIRVALQGRLDEFDMQVDFEVPASGVTALFGSSGSGKSSLLRAIAGLERRLRGRVEVAGSCWQDSRVFVPARERGVGFVFQESNLFPHLDVRGNLAFGWKRTPPLERRVAFDEVVGKLGLISLLDRSVGQLSGGERQRVALGRAVLASPGLLLLDEPLASLDVGSRREILPYLKALPEILGAPVLYVSHSVAEVKWIADWVVFLEQGRVRRHGAYSEMAPELEALDWTFSHSG
jgi:molybdate transport system ATP-binding protein